MTFMAPIQDRQGNCFYALKTFTKQIGEKCYQDLRLCKDVVHL